VVLKKKAFWMVSQLRNDLSYPTFLFYCFD